MAKIFWLLKFT